MAQLYGNRWKNLGSLNSGGQGDVFRVADITGGLDGEWALKRLRRKDRVARFRQEVGILRRLDHDNIIKLVDCRVQEDNDDEASFLVMPVAKHGDLSSRLPLYSGQLESVVEVSMQIASALDHVHKQGIVHRDIKPGNTLFPDVGHTVWVSDFGISLDQTAARNTPDGEVVGPRFFIAPELEAGESEATPAADIYSLGQLIFYMLSGGKRIARENVFDQRYNEFFSKGPRHELLRLLLGRMVALIGTRYGAMTDVMRELQQIADWEKGAVGEMFDTRGLSAIGDLQKKVADSVQRKQESEALRRSEHELLSAVTTSAVGWLRSQLEARKAVLGAGGSLDVDIPTLEHVNRQPLQVDTGNDTLLEERGAVSMLMRLASDPTRTTYVFRLHVCCEIRIILPAKDSHRLGFPGNPTMAVLPTFMQYSNYTPHVPTEFGYFLGKPIKYGVPDPVPIMGGGPNYRALFDGGYLDGERAVVRFTAAEWPAASGDIRRMMTDVHSRMMQYISKRDS